MVLPYINMNPPQVYTCSQSWTLHFVSGLTKWIGLPRWLNSKEFAWKCRRWRRHKFDPCVQKISRRRKWQSIPVFLPGESHRQRSLLGYSPWGHKEPDMTEQLSIHTHISWKNIFPLLDSVKLFCFLFLNLNLFILIRG